MYHYSENKVKKGTTNKDHNDLIVIDLNVMEYKMISTLVVTNRSEITTL